MESKLLIEKLVRLAKRAWLRYQIRQVATEIEAMLRTKTAWATHMDALLRRSGDLRAELFRMDGLGTNPDILRNYMRRGAR